MANQNVTVPNPLNAGDTLTITVASAPPPTITSVSVAPSPASVQASASMPFTATVAGTHPDKSVVWSANLGTITQAGVYTGTPAAANDVVTATSNADTTKKGTSAVTVTEPPSGESPDQTAVPPAAKITDHAAHVWTFGPPVTPPDSRGNPIYVDGAKTANGFGVLMVYSKGGVYSQTASNSWWGPLDLQGNGPKTTDPRPSQPPNGGGVPPTGTLLAFPGAMGGGARTLGGRGGVVVEVTTLADSGAGSFRAACAGTGPRTVVFRVAGIIPIMSQIYVGNPFITIAGQTAPGQIILGGKTTTESLRFSTHDVILTYLTFSPDNPHIASGPNTGTVGFYVANTQAYNFFTGHLSNRWSGNKMWIMYCGFAGQYNKDTTMQDCLNYEPHEGHPVGPSTSEGDDPARTAASKNVDFIRNFFVNIDHRITEYNHSPIRWLNNVTYNYSSYAYLALGATQADLINNVWDYNNLRPGYPKPIYSTDGNYPGSNPGTPSFYVAGNIGPGSAVVNADQFGDLAHKAQGENVINDLGPFPDAWKRSTAMAPTNGAPINLLDAINLEQTLAHDIGNSQHLDANGNWVSHRDAADTRVINQVLNRGTGGFWPGGTTTIGSPFLPPVPSTPDWNDVPIVGFPVYVSSQHDGLADAWKQAMGLDTSKAQNNVVMPNGETALNWFLAGRKS